MYILPFQFALTEIGFWRKIETVLSVLAGFSAILLPLTQDYTLLQIQLSKTLLRRWNFSMEGAG